jgi:hypothetical protein
MDLSPRSRRAIATILALVLAAETVTAVAVAAAPLTATQTLPVQPPAGAVLAADTTLGLRFGPIARISWARVADEPDLTRRSTLLVNQAAAAAVEAAASEDASEASGEKSASTDRSGSSSGRDSATSTTKTMSKEKVRRVSTASYIGTNHVWIPSLGISRSTRWFPCDRQRPPDNYMYRWGCAGANNVYLMGHAHSIMKPLHDAYVNGRLRKGTKAWYADPNGKVRVYAVRWWKVTLPTTDAAWAWAPQAVPSMTLQTCVGKNSEYRLMVRLVEVKG